MADITFRTTVLPLAYATLAYEASIAFTGNATAVTAAAASGGTLPPGLTFSADFVRITGTPTTPGTYTFSIVLTDTAGAATSTPYTLTVLPLGDYPWDAKTAAQQVHTEWPLTA